MSQVAKEVRSLLAMHAFLGKPQRLFPHWQVCSLSSSINHISSPSAWIRLIFSRAKT